VADPAQSDSEIPRQFPNVPPPDVAGSGQTRLLISAIEGALKDLKDDVKDIKSHRHSDFVFHISLLGAGFILLAGMLIAGYFKLDDRISKIEDASTRIDTKLEDLLARIPPVQAPIPRR
jgi:hypothetical protein